MYAGQDEFLHGTVAFINEGLRAGEPTLVVVSGVTMALMSVELGRDAANVQFAEMSEVGSNPARIIAVWQDFLAARSADGAPVRGSGEPIGPDRGPAELIECQRH